MCKEALLPTKRIFLQPMLPLHVGECAIPPAIICAVKSHSRALATFQNIGGAR